MATPTTFVVDLTGYKDKTSAHVEPGTYTVVVEDIEYGKSSTDNNMVTTWLRIVGGPEEGQVIVDRLVLTDKSIFRMVGFLQALGIKTPKKRLQIPGDSLKGRTLKIEVDDGDPYRGKVSSEVRGYMRDTKKAAEKADLEVEGILDGVEEPAEIEEAPAPKAKAKPAPEPVEVDEDEDEDDGTIDDAEIDLEDIDIR